MDKLIIRILVTVLALLAISNLDLGINVDGFYPALIAILLLSILNALVRPILFILTLPITILSLGLFIFVINASLFYFVASFVEGFSVTSFWAALLGSVLLSLVSTTINRLLP